MLNGTHALLPFIGFINRQKKCNKICKKLNSLGITFREDPILYTNGNGTGFLKIYLSKEDHNFLQISWNWPKKKSIIIEKNLN